ncbi:MAG: hypothetical protein MJZ60_08845 [Bacteroidaceae bacterium]|nr:hypothetical protein [Bacteroidaceae bacterium]
MAISITSLKELIDAFAVMSEKDSITPTTVATVFYRLAGLMATACSDTEAEKIRASIRELSRQNTGTAPAANPSDASLSDKLHNLTSTVSKNYSVLNAADEALRKKLDSLSSTLSKEMDRAREAEKANNMAVNAERNRASGKERTLAETIAALEKTHASDKKQIQKDINSLQTLLDSIKANLENEVIRSTKAEDDLASRMGNFTEALGQEMKRSLEKDQLIDEAIEILKRQIATEQTRAKNAEKAILAYLVALLSGRRPILNLQGEVDIDLNAEPAEIWEKLEEQANTPALLGTWNESVFSLMHTTAQDTHFLMWIASGGINMYTICKDEEEIQFRFSSLSLFE